MKTRLAGALLLLFFLTSCATTGFYFDADAKTPPSILGKILVGYGVTITAINGKKVNFGPGPLSLNVRAGDLTLTTQAVYHFRSGRLAASGSTDTSVLGSLYSIMADADLTGGVETVDVHVLPEETWFVGMEFSRSILEIPDKMRSLPANSAEPMDPKVPQARLVTKKVEVRQLPVPYTGIAVKAYVGRMPPFFNADSTQLVHSQGGAIKVVELATPAKAVERKVSDADLIWGGRRDDGSWWFLDVKGTQFIVDPKTSGVVRTQQGSGPLVKVVAAKQVGAGLMVQTGPAELIRIEPETLAVSPVWKGKSPILDWSVAEGGAFVVLSAEALTLFDAQGNEVAHRAASKKEIKTLDWTAIRGLSLSPDGSILAFHDGGGRLWFLPANDLTGFPLDQWKFLGHSAAQPVPTQVIRWAADGSALTVFTPGVIGADFSAVVYSTSGAAGPTLAVGGGPFGELRRISGSQSLSMTVDLDGSVSPDGKKFAFFFTGYVQTFYGVAILDTTRPKPIKTN